MIFGQSRLRFVVILLAEAYLASSVHAGRRLEGVDEDDDENGDTMNDNSESTFINNNNKWFHLSTYVDPDSVTYDMIQGFMFVSFMLFVLWCCWCSGIRLGVCVDPRLDKYRHSRLVRDGRGVFSKIPAHLHDDDEEEVWDDNSQVSMEFGEFHMDDEECYEDHPDIRKEEKRLLQEAADYFGEEDGQKKPAVQKSSKEPVVEQEKEFLYF